MKNLLNKTLGLGLILNLFFITQFQAQSCLENCVWAGDADRDSIVTTNDVLHIGLTQGETGPPRNTPLVWEPFHSEDWGSTLNGIDLKHSDCNGNGVIDFDDFAYPQLFYKNSYKIGNPPTDQYTPGNEICIISHNEYTMNPVRAGLTGRIRILLNEAFNIYGLTFTLEFDPSYLTLNFISDFNMWEEENNTFSMTKNLSDQGEVHFVSVRTNGANGLTKEGSINNVIIFKGITTDYANVETYIRLKNIKAILNDGTVVDFGSKDLLARVYNPDGEGQILNNENLETEKIQVFPNPASNIINIKTENPYPKHLSVIDIYGKSVFEKTTFSSPEIQLPIGQLSKGIYFLKLEMQGKSFIKKFIKI